jgi:hypothetical protein
MRPPTRALAFLFAGAVAAPALAAADAGGDGAATALDGSADGAAPASTDGGAPDGAGPDAGAPPAPAVPPQPTVTLRGRVLEKGTRRPLPGVTVAVDGAPAADTDATGAFAVEVAPGPHHVQLQLSGHEPIDRRVEARQGAPAELYRLPPRLTGERYETTVRSGHQELPRVEVTGDEARNVAGTSGDPMRVIGSLPGVSQVLWPAALYVVRGANPGNTGFFVDGVRVPALFHLALGPSVIHPYLIAGVDFYPGGYPVGYGGYVSGIAAARTAAAPTDRVHASADVTLYDAGGIVTAPFDGGKGSAAAAVRYSYTGALFSALSADSVLRYGDYQLRADHPLGGGQATLFAFGSLDDVGWINPNTTSSEYAALQFHRVDLRWRRGAGGGRLLAGLTFGADWSRSTLFDRPIRVRALGIAPRFVYERPLGSAVDLQVGADANLQRFATVVPDFQRRPSDLANSRGAYSQGVYAALPVRAGRLTVAAGVRGDLFVEQGTSVFVPEPRLDVVYRLSERVSLKADAGRFAQMPSLPVSVPGFEAFGLADLGAQTSTAGSLGVETQLPGALTAAVTGYGARLRVTDVRDIDLTRLDPEAPDYLVSRDGVAYGAEVLLRRADQGRFYGWLAYTLAWSLRYDDNGVLGRSDWDQRHILNLVAGYRMRGGLAFGTRFHFNTGRYAPIINSGGDYRQLPAFYELDLRASRRFVLDRFVLDVYLDFANVTLTREVVQLVKDPGLGSGVDEQSFRFILPTVGVHGEF